MLRRTLAAAGEPGLAASPHLAAFLDALAPLLDDGGAIPPTASLGTLATAARWTLNAALLARAPRDRWAEVLRGAEGVRRLGPEGLARLTADAASAADAVVAIAAREARLARLARGDADDFRQAIATDTEPAVAALESLRDDPPTVVGARMRQLHPALAALAVAADASASIEHEAGPSGAPARPLLDHLVRVLARKLRGLETGSRELFQAGAGLGDDAFREEVAAWRALAATPMGDVVRLALVHLDFAKGGTDDLRRAWESRLGADLSVHNSAAARILAAVGSPVEADGSALAATPLLRDRPVLREVVLALVDAHGLTGQVVRGEMPLRSLAPFAERVRAMAAPLGRVLGGSESDARRLMLQALHVVNVCDTAGVREGLMRDELRDAFVAVREQLASAAACATDDCPVERCLMAAERAPWENRGGSPAERTRARLADRLSRLRASRIAAGEPPERVRELLQRLDDADVERLAALVDRCQFWYAESGTAALSAEAQLELLALGMVRAAEAADRREPGSLFHLTCLPLVPALAAANGDPAVPYRVRLLETMLAPLALSEILRGARVEEAASPLGSVSAVIGGAEAVRLTFRESAETAALLTLLPIYERKSSAAFHATLKALCDVYGLRKDEFDRVANEELYLEHMNSARTDKERMLDYVRPGRVVEVGPGGGVVLDLCEARFPESEILGLDASEMAADALRRRRAAEHHRWEVLHGDALHLPAVVGEGAVDTVIFCSVLHEIYSYVERSADGGGPPRRFQLESVRDLLRAAYRALRPGGRIVIRDGVMPPPGVRILELLAPDAEEFLALFEQQFEGRPIRSEWVGPRRVRLPAADAMEFAYTYIWGAASFPFEVREQYGVLPYDEYRDRVVEWLSADGPPPIVVPIPPDEAQYVQDGYRQGLAGRLRFLDEHGRPCDLPATNALWVFEKPEG